jgi:hypothetical protein
MITIPGKIGDRFIYLFLQIKGATTLINNSGQTTVSLSLQEYIYDYVADTPTNQYNHVHNNGVNLTART